MSSHKAPAPDPAQQQLARTQAQVMQDQLDFNKKSYADLYALAQKQDARGDEEFQFNKGLALDAKARSDKYDALYDATTGKQTRAFSDAVDAYDTAGSRDRMAGEAISDVEGGLQQAKLGLDMDMGRRGLNPGSGAYLAALSNMNLDGGLARASAATMAQRAAFAEGLQLRAQAAGLGAGNAGLAAGSLGQAGGFSGAALGAGGTGLASKIGATSSFNQGQGIAANWGAGANSTYNSVAEQNYRRSQSGGSGLGGLIGGIAGSFMGPMGGQIGGMAGKALGGKLGLG